MNLGSKRCCINNLIKGNTGAQGAIGLQGSIGEIAATGSTGNTGSTGATGLCYRGRQGPQGSVGEQGGSTGNTGAIGPVGITRTETAINTNFTFTTDSSATYSNTGYTDLTIFATSPISNSIFLSAGSYSINWEINENWIDPENKFYVRLNGLGPGYLYPTVFNNTDPCVLYSNSSYNKIFGTGNDVITISNAGIYSIELLQSTNSSNTVVIPSKTIKFSITFIQI